MERFTISLETELAAQFDELIKVRGYGTRSEAVRDLIRSQLEAHRRERDASRYCIASLSYVYNHGEHHLAERLASIQHDHHDLAVSTMHAHLDHEQCLETSILRGPSKAVRDFANALIAERGVRHGQLNLISADIEQSRHAHPGNRPGAGHPHRHEHVRAKI
jgi:CopG family transcriptional regulator, nickel-responsive regulator